MTILEILSKGIPAMEGLKTLLLKAAEASPDLADEIGVIVAQLDAASTPEALAAVAQTIVSELASIGQGKLDGRSNPSNLI